MKSDIFERKIHVKVPVEELFGWHEKQGALERMMPPWDPFELIERVGGIEVGAKTVMKMRFGPVPYRWEAIHTEYEKNKMFRDRQEKGPFAFWEHSHLFEENTKNVSTLTDRIEFVPYFSPISNFIAASTVKKMLGAIFRYRHDTLEADLLQHHAHYGKPPMHILVTGASGLVGSSLIPFLTTGGHSVSRLIRKKGTSGSDFIFWNPEKGELEKDKLNGIDAVVHLAGENIGEGRWTDEKKKRILSSRIKGTKLLAETISGLDRPPKVLVCASAIGFYGNRPECVLTETDGRGSDFISMVCDEWEKAAHPAIKKGIRTVFLRIGVALTPLGGALKKLLLPFRLGIGGKIGKGDQYLSWVGIDDVIGSIYHAIQNDGLEGPVNVTSPNPVTNLEFTKILGNVLSRPTLMTVPEFAIKVAFGEMGVEVPLSSTRVLPEKLIESGYRFRYADLTDALRHVLGRKV